MTLASNLKKAMEARGFSGIKLASLSGVSQDGISKIIHGKTLLPKDETLTKLADALSVSVEDLMEGVVVNTGSRVPDQVKAKRVRELRKSLNMNLREFAATLEVTESCISQIETGSRSAGDSLIELMLTKYRVSRQWWAHGVGDMLLPEKKQEPQIPEHLRFLFEEISRVLPDAYTLVKKNSIVTNVLRDLREGEGDGK